MDLKTAEDLESRLPVGRLEKFLTRCQKLKEFAVSYPTKPGGRMAIEWLRQNAEAIRTMEDNRKEMFFSWKPYRNRSDQSPSWQHQQIANLGKWKGQIACGANRIGKSELGAYLCALVITGQHPTYSTPDEGRMWIVGLDAKAIDAINRPILERMMPEIYKIQGNYSSRYGRWQFNSGKRSWEVFFKSVDAGRIKFQGDKIDFAWIDEEPHKTEIFTEIETRLVDRGGRWVMTATPVMGTQWLKDQIERSDVFTTYASMLENPFIPQEEVERLASQLPEEERQIRVEGRYVIFGGRPVFSGATMESCFEPMMPVYGFLGAYEDDI